MSPIKLLTLWFKALILLIALCSIGGCGFEPLYAPGGESVSEELQAVKIDTIADRSGQQLRNFLIDTLSSQADKTPKKYRLKVVLEEHERQVGFRRDLTPRNKELMILAHFDLVESSTGETLLKDQIQAITSYAMGAHSSFGAFSSIVSERKARENALKVLSTNIKHRIASFLVKRKHFGSRAEASNEK